MGTTIEDLRKQLCEFNINRLSEFRNGIIKKITELSGENKDSVARDKLIAEITELDSAEPEGYTKQLVEDRLAKLRKELEVIDSPSTVESLKNTQLLVERKVAELQVLGC